METKKYILGRDQKWAWPKMGVANFKHGSKLLPGPLFSFEIILFHNKNVTNSQLYVKF